MNRKFETVILRLIGSQPGDAPIGKIYISPENPKGFVETKI